MDFIELTGFFGFQVVTVAVYSFVALTLMGRQLVGENKDLYFPAFAFIQVDVFLSFFFFEAAFQPTV